MGDWQFVPVDEECTRLLIELIFRPNDLLQGLSVDRARNGT